MDKNNKYYSVSNNKQHILKMVDWLITEMCSAGGDGDALWYSKYYNVKDLYKLCEEYNSRLKFPYKLVWRGDKTFHITDESNEDFVITNDENEFNNRPSWQQVTLIW